MKSTGILNQNNIFSDSHLWLWCKDEDGIHSVISGLKQSCHTMLGEKNGEISPRVKKRKDY